MTDTAKSPIKKATESPLKSPVKRTAEQAEIKKKKKVAYKKEVFKAPGPLENLHDSNGLLASIIQGRENGAGRELFNLIIDAADRLKLEYDELKFPFKIVDVGIRCMLFVDLGEWDAQTIIDDIFNNVSGSQQQHVKFCTRVVPCKVIPANMDLIIENAGKLLDCEVEGKDNMTFAVEFKSRYCEKFRQRHKNLIKIADSLLIKYNGGKEMTRKEYKASYEAKNPTNPKPEKKGKAKGIHDKEEEPKEEKDENEIITVPVLDGKLKVNLNNPDVMINVEVFKTVASVSALKNYRKFRKYNLNLVANEGFLE